jgi:hypothetical protein
VNRREKRARAQLETTNDKMLGGNNSLKAEIEKKRVHREKKKTFKERKDIIENYFKSDS